MYTIHAPLYAAACISFSPLFHWGLYCFWSQKGPWVLFQWNHPAIEWYCTSLSHWNRFPIRRSFIAIALHNQIWNDSTWINVAISPNLGYIKALISTIYILAFQALVLDKCNFIDCFPSGGPRSIGICDFGNGNGTLAPLSKKFHIKVIQICTPNPHIEKYF